MGTREQRRAQAAALLAEGSPMSTGLAALLLGVSQKTVSRWCREGRVRAGRPVHGGHWLVPAVEVARRIDAKGEEDR